MNVYVFVERVIAWLPMIVLVGIGYLLIRGSSRDNHEIMEMNRINLNLNKDSITHNQAMSETLLRIEKLLEDRKS